MKRAMSTEERKRHALLPQSIRRANSMDPSLTRTGYEQARTAWENILSSLHERGTKAKVTIICSPLRRCIGTALMISSSNTPPTDLAHFDWWSIYPLCNNKNVIPILVMNGLCSCASAIERFGGDVLRAVQAGYDIPCAIPADPPQLVCGTHNRFDTEVQQMMDVAQKRWDSFMLQFLGLQTHCLNRPPRKLQFSYHPMTKPLRPSTGLISSPRRGKDQDKTPVVKQVNCSSPPQTLQKPDHCTETPKLGKCSFSTPRKVGASVLSTRINQDQNCPADTGYCLSPPDNDSRSFLGSLNRAVQMSAAASADAGDIVLIAVTHREGIRSLVDHCEDADEVVATPYCCIGSFTATVGAPADIGRPSDRDPSIKYTFHSVISCSDFTVDYLRSVTLSASCKP
jgi:hypothetical protein